MARATSKTDLMQTASEQFEKLWKLIDSMNEEEQNTEFSFEDRDRRLRDVLVHLYEWHNLLLEWVNANQKGEQKPFLPEPYNWKIYPQMNIKFWEKHQNTSLIDAKKMLKDSHSKVMALIEAFTNDELFAKRHFTWTGSTSLGAYCVSSTSSHYDWAMKKIKKHIKSLKG